MQIMLSIKATAVGPAFGATGNLFNVQRATGRPVVQTRLLQRGRTAPGRPRPVGGCTKLISAKRPFAACEMLVRRSIGSEVLETMEVFSSGEPHGKIGAFAARIAISV